MFSDNSWLKPENFEKAVLAIQRATKASAYIQPNAPMQPVAQREPRLGLQSLGGRPVRLGESPEVQQLTPVGERVYTGIGMVHLDIEPHAVQKYKKDRRKAQKAYMKMLRYFYTRLDAKMHLSVSLPAHLKSRDYREISALVDRVVIMDYGSADPDRILRRMRHARKAIPDAKLVLALRASDFESERQLERTIHIIAQRTSLRHFAIQATAGYLDLTNKHDVAIKQGSVGRVR